MSIVSELPTAKDEHLSLSRTVQPSDSDPRHLIMLWMSAFLLLLGAMSFVVDLRVSQWMHTRQGLKGIHQPLQVIEGLGDFTGVMVILYTIYLVAVPRRRELFRICCSVPAAGIAANLVKFCIARTRPRSYPGEGLLDLNSIGQTFQGWFPFLHSESVFINSKFQSFPSGHAATGAALAVGLTKIFPQAGWWFAFLAAAVALQRVETGAHYVSDTCFGGALGILVGLTFQRGTAWSRWFDTYEAQPKRAVERIDS